MATVKLGRRTLASLGTVQKTTVLYDSDLKGFGLRLTPASTRNPGGSRTWIVEYRPGAGGRAVAKKRVSLGSADTVSPEQARDAAKTLLAKVRLGTDPTAERLAERAAKTIRELHVLYSAEFDPIRKPRTVVLYNGYWNKHILPVLGSGLVDHSQKITVAARATAEKKAVGQRS